MSYSQPRPRALFHGRYRTFSGAIINVDNSRFIVKREEQEPEVQVTFDHDGRATAADGGRLPNYDLREMVRPGSGQ
jgi:hypothetical protein